MAIELTQHKLTKMYVCGIRSDHIANPQDNDMALGLKKSHADISSDSGQFLRAKYSNPYIVKIIPVPAIRPIHIRIFPNAFCPLLMKKRANPKPPNKVRRIGTKKLKLNERIYS